MKNYFCVSSTFIISAVLLFCTNRLYEALTSIGLTSIYYLSTFERIIYVGSFVFFAIGIAFLYMAFKKSE